MLFSGATSNGPTLEAELEHNGARAQRVRLNVFQGVLRIELGLLSGAVQSFEFEAPHEQTFVLPQSHRFAVTQVLDPDTQQPVWRLPDDVLLRTSWRATP